MLDFNNARASVQADPVLEFGQLIDCPGIVADGEIHRYGEKKAKWYVLFADPDFVAGAYGDWREDTHNTWCSKRPSEFTVVERVEFEKKIAIVSEKREKEKELANMEAAKEALRIWGECKKKDISHPYLSTKK